MTDQIDSKLGEIIAKTMEDADFKARFKSDPGAVLEEHGIAVPEGVTVRVVENTDDEVFISLPAAPAGGVELADDDLEAVAGGGLGRSQVSASAVYTFRRAFFSSTSNQSVNTCGKSCIPW